MENILKATNRKDFKKNATYRLRQEGYVPGVVSAHGETKNIQFLNKDLFAIYKDRMSESVVIKIDVDGDQVDAVVKDCQRDPVTEEILHVDFYKVTSGEKIKTEVELKFVGTPAGVKKGGVLELHERMIHIECLPAELPEVLEIDLSKLEIGESFKAADFKAEGSLKIISDQNIPLASVTTMKEEDAEEATEEKSE